MKLRMLREKDAPLMLEWMHDDSVVCDMRNDFASKSLEDCISFIRLAQETTNNLHLAIVDENDIYMGTVSLKHISKSSAEFGIVVRKCAMGLGYAQYALQSVVKIGFEKYGLQRVFWCVSPKNNRAVRFYDKNGYSRINFPYKVNSFYTKEELTRFIWYGITNCSC